MTVWLSPAVLLAAQDEQLAEHGGTPGFRNQDRFEAVLARPQTLGGDPAAQAVAYAAEILRKKGHPFVSGNKRIALVALEAFLLLNGHELTADDGQCVLAILSLASGDIGETELADWVRRHSRRME